MDGIGEPSRAVVLMALGGPTSLAEVEPYLLDLRGGRPTSAELVEEIRERYRKIGGSSPLPRIAEAQASALGRRLTSAGHPVRCAAAMRHGHPRIDEVVRRLLNEGVRDFTGVCLTPFYSEWSVGGYQRAFGEAIAGEGRGARYRCVDHWYAHPALADTFGARVLQGLSDSALRGYPDPLVLFTAHSLPGVRDPETEPYVVQLHALRSAVEQRVPAIRSRLAYQSVGRREGPWLGPSVTEELERANGKGERAVLIAPIGFVSDNLEILYDVDIEMRGEAQRLGLAFGRTASLNDAPGLIEALADAVRAAEEMR